MARGLDQENQGPTPPRRNPFRQEIKSKEELDREESLKGEAKTQKGAREKEMRTREEEYQKITEELRLLLKKRIEVDRSLDGDRHQAINTLNEEIRQKDKERDGLLKVLQDLRREE